MGVHKPYFMKNIFYSQRSAAAVLAAGLCLTVQAPAWAGPFDLLPKPKSMELADCGPFALGRAVRVTDPTQSVLLQEVLQRYGCTLTDEASAPTLTVELVSTIEGAFNHQVPYMPDEAYAIEVRPQAITIKALNATGVIRAAQTLNQLAEGTAVDGGAASIESLSLADWPAFKVRGFMHDVGRSFIPFDELKKEIDLLSRFKVNVFHWHLTEKLAWRFEVKAYPQLTQADNMTRYAGDYYTQEQCTELEAYAAERGVTVIPEIDMPGHSAAFTKAMGFDMQSDQGVEALKKILDEVIAVFPKAPYIHIGGDEVQITYPNFLKNMAAYVRGKGKKVVMWNRLVAGAPTSEQCDMTQMWATAGRVVKGLPNIDCRYNYTNHFDVYADLVGIYKSNIYYEQKGTNDVAGTISAAWNDTKTASYTDIVKQNNMYANILASTERAWCGGGKQYIEAGGTNLPNAGEEYEEFADFETRFLFHKAHSLANEPIAYVKQSNVRWRITDPFPNGGDKTLQLPPELTDEGADGVLPTTFTYNGTTYGSRVATGAGIYLRHIWHPTIPSWFSNPSYGQTAYAWTYVYSPVAQDAGAQVEFYTYSRSGNEKAPLAGEWDRRGSKLWVNGQEIAAPTWDQADASIPQDHSTQGLTNENLTARPVVQLHLKEGWNKVLMRLPHAAASGTGRDKWQFTFVLTDPEGRNALDGIIYSPAKVKDAASETLSMLMDDIDAYLVQHFQEGVGYYPTELAATLQAKLDEVRATLGQDMTEAERTAQRQALSEAYSATQQAVQAAEINQPLASDEQDNYWYAMSTPLRGNRYPTSQGDGQALLGQTTKGKSATWKFEKRTDGSYNIICAADGLYISPASSFNTALTTVSSVPAKGWSIKPADEVGYVIITSGDVEFNQTNHSSNYAIYNWGGGNNTSDTGCKYKFESVELPEAPKMSTDQVAYWYTISSPLRDNRFTTSYGVDQVVKGDASAGEKSQWKLQTRADGSFNLVNRADGVFISPASANNTALYGRGTEPEAGWTLLPASTEGYYAIVSGNAQINQTKSNQQYQLFNWGGGTNTADTGCQFCFTLVEREELIPEGLHGIGISSTQPAAYYDLSGRRVARPAQGVYITQGRKVLMR